ncbi:murein biosynthesis integral membrane protein MurJ [Streptomyces radicis]|uniref:Murein biosynthesis integral membrane protein MurJ n=1 Tax=Streptomyces radicis TaxID=1750517 RepID=A0A3A9WE82_9ACTN|nr:murein biosynthesis integral membrane protein MurJ [Streptomyces radicis]RKN11305.1 murein biosynthesis integral membrane protein MurJ [Streptomyces radicis]RKN26672.1 murein biosynthesis integral membrane protein MurJ [Streptomyces radicis]
MEAPYDRERGRAPGGGDQSGWQGDQHGHPEQQGPYPPGYDPYAGQQPYPYEPGGHDPGAPDPYGPAHGQAPGGYPGQPYPPPGYGPGHPGPPAGGQGYAGPPEYHPPAYDPGAYDSAGYQGPDDPYLADSYHHDPYAGRDPLAQDPVGDALYDRAAHPPPPASGVPDPQGLYQQPPPGPHAPDAQRWAPTPAPEPDALSRHLPHGDRAATTEFTGIDGLMNRAGETAGSGPQGQRPGPDDAFAHLFRDQQAGPGQPPAGGGDQPPRQTPEPGPAARPEPQAAAPSGKTSKAAGLLKSSAIMAAGTLVSRVTGFVRQLVLVAALGAAVLGDSYTVAWNLPNMIYILIIGGGLNSVFVPQLVRAMKNDSDGGEAYANRLLTLVMVLLGALVVAAVLAAPLLVRLMSPTFADDPAANEVTVTFTRYFLPTIFFMGVHVVLGQILNARGSFGPMMWTPVLNNIVVIFTFGMFLWVYGTQATSGMGVTTISDEGLRLLGAGTLLGLVVQAVALLPYLRAAGFRVRLRFDWRGKGLGKAATMAKWTVLFVLANQVGLIVVTQIATWAGANALEDGHSGAGFIAYSSALLIWQMPQAIITVSLMAALLPRLSRSAADGDTAAVRDDLSHGLRTSAVAIVPIAFAFVALGVPMCTLLFGTAGESGARSFGYVLMAFGVGLIPYSAQYVVLRAFYAYEDTRTPFYNTVIVSATWILLSALSFVLLPERWVVAGIAFGYGVAYAVGVRVAWRRLKGRMRVDLDGARVVRTYIRLAGASIPAAVIGGGTGFLVLRALGEGAIGSVAALAVGGLLLLAVFYVAARRMRVEELTALVGMVRARLGR